MTETNTAGVYVEEAQTVAHSIAAVSTDVAGFVGFAARGPYRAKRVTSLTGFKRLYGTATTPADGFLPFAVEGFFANGGRKAYIARIGSGFKAPVTAAEFIGHRKAMPLKRRGLAALADIDEISILAIPDALHPRVRPRSRRAILAAALAQCETQRGCIVLIDSPGGARDLGQSDAAINQITSSYAAVYGPWLEVTTAKEATTALPPSGHVAGIYARSDTERGVWTAPTGAQADLRGAVGLGLTLSENEMESLSDGGVNAIRDFSNVGRGILLWDVRTRSAEQDWKYINVRRLVIFLEESIDRGLQWAVVEPNGDNLWAKVRASVADFLLDLWHKGALVGVTADRAFFVRCDRTTMTQDDLDNGRLVCQIGVAPVRPAEFVIFRIGIITHCRKS
jgi:phage tail sheath protein FI